jgi:hypothetical protein
MLNLSRNLGLITVASVMDAVFGLASATIEVTTARPEAVAENHVHPTPEAIRELSAPGAGERREAGQRLAPEPVPDTEDRAVGCQISRTEGLHGAS